MACGTSWHAALVGKYLVEEWARLSAEAEIASELRHRHPVVGTRPAGGAHLAVGRDGRHARRQPAAAYAGHARVAISNIVGSSLAREADGVLYTRAGLEIGVAATKTFTTQLAAVTLLALKIALARGAVDSHFASDIIAKLLVGAVVDAQDARAERCHPARSPSSSPIGRDFLYLGRGLQYPMALEGALKLKEICLRSCRRLSGRRDEARSDRAHRIGDADCGDRDVRSDAGQHGEQHPGSEGSRRRRHRHRHRRRLPSTRGVADIQIPIPRAPHWLQPFLVAIPLQLLAYHSATLRGANVDQPRNLAKSVTVE